MTISMITMRFIMTGNSIFREQVAGNSDGAGSGEAYERPFRAKIVSSLLTPAIGACFESDLDRVWLDRGKRRFYIGGRRTTSFGRRRRHRLRHD
ncbi:hypothetical protein HGP16_32255 [Rhizobium sp. P40RR-XXII]|uniref:hypothetical protein n=1 Tax=unclassified Rhizobium TaxID=2613769 RepID=UPI0014563EE6|nr:MULTISPECIES: hypothetical protein [unclassified Rhizobium]NLR89310.1 hypothetical protein [Rhizobium sp. P28RR-XV]NLS21172.1 hypothetical protein [Rhizobium sp. P40RR-XXII]